MKVAMVSGGGRGVGAAITRKLLEDGWTVSLGPPRPAQADAFGAPEGRLAAFAFDATDPATAAPGSRARSTASAASTRSSTTRASSGSWTSTQGTEDDLDAMWAVNVKAPFRLIREALPHLRKTGTGRVINIASTDAKRYRAGVSIGYTMTKHALLALNQAVRFAAWDDGVRATAVCPGATDTDLIAHLPGVTPKAERLTPETVAAIVAFLLTLPNQASVPEFIANTRLESLI
jgi:NAD(P)-dependent dehydrogenase (short-subunit alcohol dehydrogenase family)